MASVKQSWINKFGVEEGTRKWEERKLLSACTIESFVKKHGDILGKEKYNEWKNNLSISRTLPAYVKKYGKKVGTQKYKEKNSHLSVSNRALKLSGKTKDEIKLIQETHSKNSTITLETLCIKYGDAVGVKKWNDRIFRAKISSKRSLDYWIKESNGDIEIAKKKLSDYQRRDKKFYVEKYGEISGTEKYELVKRKRFLGGFIEPCSKFQKEIEDFILEKKVSVYGRSSPWVFFLENGDRKIHCQSMYIPDIVLKDEKLIIECFGDYWHCNPTKYSSEFFHEVIKKTAKEIQEKDNRKLEYYKSKGFDILVIWESGWNNNKDFYKQRILDEINKKRN